VASNGACRSFGMFKALARIEDTADMSRGSSIQHYELMKLVNIIRTFCVCVFFFSFLNGVVLEL
jgi:hypothetical protein